MVIADDANIGMGKLSSKVDNISGKFHKLNKSWTQLQTFQLLNMIPIHLACSGVDLLLTLGDGDGDKMVNVVNTTTFVMIYLSNNISEILCKIGK